jgi:hypothetical protein
MGACLSEPDFGVETIPGLLVDDLTQHRDGQQAVVQAMRATNAEQRVRIEKLQDMLHETQRLNSALEAKIIAAQAVDARQPIDCYGVARLAKNLPTQIDLAHVVLAIGSKALDLGNIKARDLCDEAFDLLDPSGCAENVALDVGDSPRQRPEVE